MVSVRGKSGVRCLQRPRGERLSWQSRGGKGTGGTRRSLTLRGLWGGPVSHSEGRERPARYRRRASLDVGTLLQPEAGRTGRKEVKEP